MRSFAHELGVKPMSLYHHVANEDEILDGTVSEIELPPSDGDWRSEMHRRAISARRVLRCQPWAIGRMKSRTTPGAATPRHHNPIIGTLRGAGFSARSRPQSLGLEARCPAWVSRQAAMTPGSV
jgi:hypothetical protein